LPAGGAPALHPRAMVGPDLNHVKRGHTPSEPMP
jgi:hypothetical protein